MAQRPYAGKPDQDKFLEQAFATGFKPGSAIRYAEIDEIFPAADLPNRPWWLINAPEHRGDERGTFILPAIGEEFPKAGKRKAAKAKKPVKRKASPKPPAAEVEKEDADRSVATLAKVSSGLDGAIPNRDAHFVPFGNFKDVKAILAAEMFYPIRS